MSIEVQLTDSIPIVLEDGIERPDCKVQSVTFPAEQFHNWTGAYWQMTGMPTAIVTCKDGGLFRDVPVRGKA